MERFNNGKSILGIAQEFNHPPYLVARVIVDQLSYSGTLQGYESTLTQIMNDPWTALMRMSNPTTANEGEGDTPCQALSGNKETDNDSNADIDALKSRLSNEVLEAVRADPLNGPPHSRECNMLGIEYEVRLEERLRGMDIPFESEEMLRVKGTAKTPDVLLSYPLGIRVPVRKDIGDPELEDGATSTMEYEWKMICWIDSKALFGDVQTHELDVLPQAEKYVHRFGPGLILYWFGHAPLHRLRDARGDVVVIAWDLPTYFMLPTGDYVGRGTVKLASYLEGGEEELFGDDAG